MPIGLAWAWLSSGAALSMLAWDNSGGPSACLLTASLLSSPVRSHLQRMNLFSRRGLSLLHQAV
eukprot:700487-Pelagomonas_calceolata.AAC.1